MLTQEIMFAWAKRPRKGCRAETRLDEEGAVGALGVGCLAWLGCEAHGRVEDEGGG